MGNRSSNSEKIKPKLSKQIESLLQQKQAHLEGKWEQAEACSLTIVQWRCEKLHLGLNNKSNILKQIKKINFCFLKLLAISTNAIESIEGISTINIPLLETFLARQNYLTTVKALRKTNFPKFSSISISKNPILDVEKIALIDSKATFQFFVIDEKGKDKINEDIRWLAKMKRKEMSTFYCLSNERISQVETYETIERKFRRDWKIKALYCHYGF